MVKMDISSMIPMEIRNEAQVFFGGQMLVQTQKLMDQSRISISFQKGSPERFFIISGIVSDGNTYESKVTFKKNEKYPNGYINSSCNCHLWTEANHCTHVAALYVRFLVSHALKDEVTTDESIIRPELSLRGHGVHAHHYGRIINSASALNGAKMNSTYSSLQYILTNRKVVNFPLPKRLTGKIILNLVPASSLEEFRDYPSIENKFYPTFSYKAEDENKKISIFESLYLFDWNNGFSYEIPPTVQNLLKTFRNEGYLNDINSYLKLLTGHMDREDFEVTIAGNALKDIHFEEALFRINIHPSTRKGYLDLELQIYNQKQQLVSPPPVFKIFLNDEGFLRSFRTKNDSYTFLKAITDSFDYENNEYKKFMYSSSKKDHIQKWIDYLTRNNEIYFMDTHHDTIYQLTSNSIKLIIQSLFVNFQETASRFSYFDSLNKCCYFQVPKNQLFSGIANFHKALAPLQIPIFYNQQEIKSWSSNIRFERRKSDLNWFELDLLISAKDLQVIKNADMGENYLVTDQGLVLLDAQEKELLKFMKKYTNHESNDQSSLEDSQVQKFSLNLRRARIFELFELKKHGINGALTQEEEALCNNLLSLQEMPHYDLPTRYQDIARDYQVTGYNWLRFLYGNQFGACLADDMGLGKTLQTIMFLQSIINKVDKVLIVCPVSILINWQNEIEKFSDIEVDVYYGGNRTKPGDQKVILTSYGVMKKESYTTFNEMKFDVLIMDEVQHLKNIRSQGASAARNLQANFRICLTGTPVENDLSEFYNIIDLCIPGIWGEISFLKTTSTKKSRLLARKTVRPFILRRTKEQVLTELPEKIENHVYLNFNEQEREQYITTLAQIRQKMESIQAGRKYGEVLKSLLRLRQLCLWQNQNFLQSTKVEFLLENLEQILEEKHKAIVFSQFTTYLDIIQNKVQERGWNFVRIDGSQSFKKRADQVEKFQNGDAEVFLISLKAGGVGLNLTAASYIFLMDPWWNPAVENQAIDRAHRIGQENKVTVYRPIIKDSVEEKVMVLQNIKKELFKDLMADNEDTQYNGKLTMEDFQMLLS